MKENHVRAVVQGMLALFVLLIGVFGAKALIASRNPPSKAPPPVAVPLVEVIRAQSSDVELVVHAQGTVVPHTESLLLSEVSGRVLEVAPEMRAGSRVVIEQLLVRIDDADYRLALVEAKSALAQAQLRLEQVRADADSARRDWERSGNEGEASALVLREPQLADARAQFALAEARREKAQRDLERCTVRAPFAGRVRSAMVDRGQFVARGAQLATLVATDVLEVRIPLPDKELAHLDLPLGGDIAPELAPEARISARFGGQERHWDARIVRTETDLDPASRMVVAVARVDEPVTDDGQIPLGLGMFVEVDVRGRVLRGKHELPREVLQGGDRVYVVDDENRLRFRGVEVLRRTRDTVVIGTGLSDDDRVIVSPLEAPVDGMTVRPVEAVR